MLPVPFRPPFASVTGCRGAGRKHVNVVLPEGWLVDLEFGDNSGWRRWFGDIVGNTCQVRCVSRTILIEWPNLELVFEKSRSCWPSTWRHTLKAFYNLHKKYVHFKDCWGLERWKGGLLGGGGVPILRTPLGRQSRVTAQCLSHLWRRSNTEFSHDCENSCKTHS